MEKKRYLERLPTSRPSEVVLRWRKPQARVHPCIQPIVGLGTYLRRILKF
ncbi:hypothetical protein M1O17_04840 [Dehalococcoidia bacterium]|nr:hypothetical protein [Dehalococcoidia bacterium]